MGPHKKGSDLDLPGGGGVQEVINTKFKKEPLYQILKAFEVQLLSWANHGGCQFFGSNQKA